MSVPRTWWTIAERDDHDRASDGFSRYGIYVADRVEQAVAHEEFYDAAGWTAWCWRVATRPVMSPSYIGEAAPIEATRLWRDPDTGGLAVTLVAAAPLPPGLGRLWRTWHVDRRDGLSFGDLPRALSRIEFEAVLDEPLIGWAQPPRLPCDRRILVGAAKDAVRRTVGALNERYTEPLDILAASLGLTRDRGVDLTHA